MKALAGKRVLITRAKAQSSKLKTLLEEAGAEVIAIPSIEIVPPDSYDALDAALHTIVCYDWLVLTSANAVEAIAQRSATLNIPLETYACVYIAAIGGATADAITQLGLAVELIPPRAVAESLAESLVPLVKGKRVLIVRAKIARDVLPEALTHAGASVTIVEAYQNVIPLDSIAQLQAELLKAHQPIDAITFTSASSVQNFIALMEAAGLKIPAGTKMVSIGPITTAALVENGLHADAQAKTASIADLVAAVID
jgi:uroporphyrinogen-III synthase